MLANRRYCYPLTITDFASRYLLSCEALSSTREAFAFAVFERRSRTSASDGHSDRQRRALRLAARPLRLSRLAVWWLRLGIQIERIKPGHPNRTGGTNACISR